MKANRINNVIFGGKVSGIAQSNGVIDCYLTSTQEWESTQGTSSKETQIHTRIPFAGKLQEGDSLLVKGRLESATFGGNNDSTYKATYLFATEVLGHCGPERFLNLNQTILGGNVGNVEENESYSNVALAVTTSRLVDDSWTDTTLWTRLTCTKKLREQNFKHGISKGDSVSVEGELSSNWYKDSNGNAINKIDVRINRVINHIHRRELDVLKQNGLYGTRQDSSYSGQPQQPPQNHKPSAQRREFKPNQQSSGFNG
ncbi:single-stranded DNA-binding protein [Enterovibrio norvegicus]|uniref:single-stranded DNA-binding protein n=1 Tax=Enterovibrio norvegicus TaxID=188144 RepID=UPI00352E6FAC